MRPPRLALLLLLTQCGRIAPSPKTPSNFVVPKDAVVTPSPPPAQTPTHPCGQGTPRPPRQRTALTKVVPTHGPVVPAKELAWSADRTRLLATREDDAAFVVGWNESFPSRRLQGTPLPRPRQRVDDPGAMRESFVISEDGQRVVASSWAYGDHGWEVRQTERLWNATTGAILATRTVVLSGHRFVSTPRLDRRAILGSGYFADAGYHLHLAGIPARSAQTIVRGDTLFLDAAWSPTGDRLAVTRALPGEDLSNARSFSHPATFTMWRSDPPTKLFERRLDHDHIGGFVGDGSLVVVTNEGRTRVFDAETGREAFAFDAQGSLLASRRRDVMVMAERQRQPDGLMSADVFVIDLTSGQRRPLATLADGAAPALDASGTRLAITTRGRVCVLDVDDGRSILDVAIETSADFAWSADGQALVTRANGGIASLSLADESITDVDVGFGAP